MTGACGTVVVGVVGAEVTGVMAGADAGAGGGWTTGEVVVVAGGTVLVVVVGLGFHFFPPSAAEPESAAVKIANITTAMTETAITLIVLVEMLMFRMVSPFVCRALCAPLSDWFDVAGWHLGRLPVGVALAARSSALGALQVAWMRVSVPGWIGRLEHPLCLGACHQNIAT